MYGYIYDVFLTQKLYEREINKIENSLTDLGLSGHIIKLSLINNTGHAVDEMIKKGIKTIVAVGSDQLFSKIVDQVELLSNVTLGLIPMGKHRQLAKLFGLPEGEAACSVLGARLVQPVSLGKVNNAYFVHSAKICDASVKINCHDKFVCKPTTKDAMISILNLKETSLIGKRKKPALSLVITPNAGKSLLKKSGDLPSSLIRSHRITIKEPVGIPIVIDGQKVINTPAKFTIVPEKIQVIMGRERRISDE